MRAILLFVAGGAVGSAVAWAGLGARTVSAHVAAGVMAPAARGPACPCPGDANCDGTVDFNDIVTVLGNWLTDCAPDADFDGVPDGADNCPNTPNPTQADADSDLWGDACDCNPVDSSVNPGALEVCGDGIDNDCDGFFDFDDFDCAGDSDMDGVPDAEDNCPTVPNPTQADADNDLWGDECDCSPFDPAVSPAAAEICNDGIDNDCDGFVDLDDFDCP